MHLQRLRYFLVVADELHFGRAAARLHMAQPPLSQQIRRLEEELQLTLFERTTRRVTLTAAGKLLQTEARSLLDHANQVTRTVETFRDGTGGQLRVGFVDSSAYEVMPRFLRAYRKRWPDVTFDLRTMSSDQQRTALLAGEIDLGIGRTGGTNENIAAHTFLRERLYVAVESGHRLAKQKSASLGPLNDQPMVGITQTASPSHHLDMVATFGEHGLAYQPVLEVPDYTSLLGLVAAGEGVAVVPAGVRSFQPPGLAYIPVRAATAFFPMLLLRRRSETLPAVRQAIDLVDSVF